MTSLSATNTDAIVSTDRGVAGQQPDNSTPTGGQTPVSGSGGVPVGIIAMWSGTLATIPNGWALCDGGGGRPDLRSMFIKGAAAGDDPGATGGATNHTPAGTVSQPTFSGAAAEAANTNSTPHLVAPDTSGTGVTVVTTATGTVSQPTFTGTSANYEPTFYSLAFIMKT